jgi:purine-binding chemotaxis protein CheW
MKAGTEKQSATGTVELATFYVGDALCGMDILKVQEINKMMEMTQRAPGALLRHGHLEPSRSDRHHHRPGQKAGTHCQREVDESSRNIIVNSDNEYIGLLVSRIGDVVQADWQNGRAAPGQYRRRSRCLF